MQEVIQDSYVDIPGEVLDIYRIWRPTPLFRARRLEKLLDTPAKIFYKYEGVSPAGSHKPNTSVPQAYYNAQAGVDEAHDRDRRRPVGLVRWRSPAPSSASSARCGRSRPATGPKPYRKTMMEIWGATVHPSPSERHRVRPVAAGRGPRPHRQPRHRHLRGRRRGRAARPTSATPSAACSTTCCMHQTIIGEEALLQLAMVGETPDVLVGCTGGGSNFGGLSLPVPPREAEGQHEPDDPMRRTGRVSRASPRASTATTSATPPA